MSVFNLINILNYITLKFAMLLVFKLIFLLIYKTISKFRKRWEFIDMDILRIINAKSFILEILLRFLMKLLLKFNRFFVFFKAIYK